MTDEEAFLRAIAENPDDESCRLVFADWLEERGDDRAEFLRLDCALRRLTWRDGDYADAQERWWALRADLDPAWLAVLGQSKIENCDLRFRFRCPQRWEKLKPTELPLVRSCDRCRKEVYYCDSIDQAKEHACAGHCVAVDVKVARQPGDLDEEEIVVMTGEPDGEDDMVMGELTDDELMLELDEQFEAENSTEFILGGLDFGPPQETASPLQHAQPPQRKKPWWRFW
jgi:uncharacterized protein (TIGR02996 family)